ncbi:hypothetical protein AQ764_10510 [Burkholderia pseudomallei]|nr:hypothetical protein BHT10_09485 [Burkholderia pseudomallei]OMT70183.1 hypothetical protein AQ764_10510 [Burkholderia pseudomallei]TOZ65199.1 hypothetical protein DIJ60_05295 [Burkholderia pseudomallei]
MCSIIKEQYNSSTQNLRQLCQAQLQSNLFRHDRKLVDVTTLRQFLLNLLRQKFTKMMDIFFAICLKKR